MKKKIIALFTALICLAVCLTACGSGTADCSQTYKDAEAKTAALTRFSAGVETSLSLDLGDGAARSISTVTRMDADITSSIYLQAISGTDSVGGAQNITVYHENGATYYSDGTNSFKYAEDDASAMSSVKNVADFGIPGSALKNAELTEENGEKKISCTASGEEMKSLCESYLDSLDAIAGESFDYDISDVKVDLTVNADGYLVFAGFSFSAGFDNGGARGAAVVDAKIKYTDVSGKAPIEAPEGYLDYPDYDGNSGADTGDMSEMQAEAIDAAFSLFEDDYVTPVANYDELYKQYCAEYGKETMDAIIELILAFGGLAAGG